MNENSLSKELLEKIKADEKFFKEFMNFLEKNFEKREIILLCLRRIIIDSLKELKND